MEDIISKSVEYLDSIQNKEYLVKALIVSAPEELEIKNIDKEENEGFIFAISVLTKPDLPTTFLYYANLIFIVGNSGVHRLGYIDDGNLVEIKENTFTRTLQANVLEVLLIEGKSGHFKS